MRVSMYIAPFVAAVPFAFLGLHLGGVARRSGALPDRLLAAFFLLLAAGVPPRMLAVDLATHVGRSWTGFWLSAAASLAIGSALACLAAFTWQVFRPGKRWAKRVFQMHAAAMFAAFAAGTTSLRAADGSGPIAIVFNGLAALALVWAFAECLLYYRRMRRQRVVGLAEPVLANRFLLWAVWTGALGFQGIVMMLLRIALWSSGDGEVLLRGEDPGGPWLALIAASKGLLAIVAPAIVVSVWLSFSPPAAYRRWLEKGSPRAA